MSTQLDIGLAKEKLYSPVKLLQQKEEVIAEQQAQAGAMEQMSGAKWLAIESNAGKKSDVSLKADSQDAVYLSLAAQMGNVETIESPTALKIVSFKDKLVSSLTEKLGKAYAETFSHNFFEKQLSKIEVGVIRFQLGMLGVSTDTVKEVLAVAREEKKAVVKTAVAQVASEKTLFMVVTGAKFPKRAAPKGEKIA